MRYKSSSVLHVMLFFFQFSKKEPVLIFKKIKTRIQGTVNENAASIQVYAGSAEDLISQK